MIPTGIRFRNAKGKPPPSSREDVTPEVSLTDDPAADSLDLLELGLALERKFRVVPRPSILERLRIYLLAVVQALVPGPETAAAAPQTRAGRFSARVVPAAGDSSRSLQRAGWLTPYAIETIAEYALHAGPGARLEMTLPSSVSDTELALLRDEFAWLGERGVQASVRRDYSIALIEEHPIPPPPGGLTVRWRAARGLRHP